MTLATFFATASFLLQQDTAGGRQGTRPLPSPPPARALSAPTDSGPALIRRARRAEAQYELVARTRAPMTLSGGSGQNCDEIVGRFCLVFDDEDKETPPPPEPKEATRARLEAVQALERAAAVVPAEPRVARSLVRLLVESRRDTAALDAARRYAAGSPGLWAELLLGFALHAAGDDTAADLHFARAFPQLGPRERRRLHLERLVSREEGAALTRLDSAARAGYEAALWKLGDPLYLTIGNEVRGEYLARYVWGRMYSELPVVRGMTSWGDDLEELTLRYGVPTARERVPGRSFFDQDGMVEHYDPAQLPFLPESLMTVGVRPAPAPGDRWTLEDTRARSGFAPVTVRRMIPLPAQVTRFPAGDSIVLRVDGVLVLDSVARGATTADAGLFVLPGPEALLHGDTAQVGAAAAPTPVVRDTAFLSFSTTLSPGRYVYSAEALERRSRLAARARYLVELHAPPAGVPALSDVLMAKPFARRMPARHDDARLRGLPEAVVVPGDTVGLYAEAGGLAGAGRYRVELTFGPSGAPSIAGRLRDWLRARAGGGAPTGVRLAWSGDAPPEGEKAPVALATDIVVPRLPAGLYALRLDVTNGATGATATTIRVVRVVNRRR